MSQVDPRRIDDDREREDGHGEAVGDARLQDGPQKGGQLISQARFPFADGGDQYLSDQPGGRFRIFCRATELHDAANVRDQLPALAADSEVGLELTLADCFQPALQVIAREIFDFQVRHEFPRRRERSRFPLPVPTPYSLLCIRFSTRASSNRPRLIRDLTVPWGTPRICAISS